MTNPLRQIQEDCEPLDLWWTALESAQKSLSIPLPDDWIVLRIPGYPEVITAGQFRKMLNTIYQIGQEAK